MPEAPEDRERPPIGRPTQPRPDQPRLRPRASPVQAVVVIGIAVLLLAVVFAPGGGSTTGGATPAPKRSSYDHIDIRLVCEGMVKEQLVSPSSARVLTRANDRPTWDPTVGDWHWSLEVESQNAFGVWLRSRWACATVDDDGIFVVQLD